MIVAYCLIDGSRHGSADDIALVLVVYSIAIGPNHGIVSPKSNFNVAFKLDVFAARLDPVLDCNHAPRPA